MTILNIKYRNEGLERLLSNLNAYSFDMDGYNFNSYEGFVQSLKTPVMSLKQVIWKQHGYEAWKSGEKLDWYTKQELYWIEKPIDRHSEEYLDLITRAYDCLYKNDEFRENLIASYPCKLEHSIGGTDPHKTIMTRKEFLYQLNRLRDKSQERKFHSLFNF